MGECSLRSAAMRLVVALLSLGCALRAAQSIEVTAHFADVPASAEVPLTLEKLGKVSGANLLSSPSITILEEVVGTIEVVQPISVPGARQVPLGVSVSVKTSVTAKGNIWFSGQLTDRSRGGGGKTERLETAGFATREWYFSGYTTPGGTVVIRTTPATAQVVRDGQTVASSRELVAYLTFDRAKGKTESVKSGASATGSKGAKPAKKGSSAKPAARKK